MIDQYKSTKLDSNFTTSTDEQLSHVIIATYYNLAGKRTFHYNSSTLRNNCKRIIRPGSILRPKEIARIAIFLSYHRCFRVRGKWRKRGGIYIFPFYLCFSWRLIERCRDRDMLPGAMRFVAFRSDSGSGVINDIVGLIAFRREGTKPRALPSPRPLLLVEILAVDPLPHPSLVIDEKCFNFVSSRVRFHFRTE